MPDTLDLREHARASLEFLVRVGDPAQGRLPYFWTFYDEDPAELRHNHWDYCENPGRNLYGLVAARQVTGSLEGLEAERDYQRLICRTMTGGNGLCWRPAHSPFARGDGRAELNLWDNRSDFMGLLSLYMADRDPAVLEQLEGMLDGLERLAIRQPDCIRFEKEALPPGYRPDTAGAPRVGQHSGGWITPLVKYHEVTGSHRALELAHGLADFVVRYHHTSLGEGKVLGIANVHGALFTLAGVIRVAALEGDQERLDWAEALVRYAADSLASDFGWVREMEGRDWMKPEDSHSCEICAVVDLLQCALLLAQHGYPQYWDLAERYLRNYFTAAQLLDTGWMRSGVRREDNIASSFTEVPARVRGCFAGWGAPNDLVDPNARVKGAIQNCCGPHGAWGLFLAWRRIVTRDPDGGVRVNLALNRETPWCRVESYRPYAGRVDIVMYYPLPLLVRVPGFADRSRVLCRIDGAQVEFTWDGDYVSFPETLAGQRISVIYPLPRERRSEVLDGREYRVDWKGDTVVRIDPPGKIVPLFDRGRFLKDEPPYRDEPDFRLREVVDRALNEIDW